MCKDLSHFKDFLDRFVATSSTRDNLNVEITYQWSKRGKPLENFGEIFFFRRKHTWESDLMDKC